MQLMKLLQNKIHVICFSMQLVATAAFQRSTSVLSSASVHITFHYQDTTQ